MMYGQNNMKIKAHKVEVLTALRLNREEHQQIVKEARVGYIEKAKQALSAKLDELASGKIAHLSFGLMLPADYTKEYDTAIRMLELHQEDFVELDEALVRCFVLNQWEWMSQFIGSNVAYSATAMKKSYE